VRGFYLPGSIGVDQSRRTRNVWIVLLYLQALKPESAQSIVAHELGHIWLGHAPTGGRGTEEVDAAALVREWGFKGAGTRPSWLPLDAGS
jgi:hypothetical protein